MSTQTIQKIVWGVPSFWIERFPVYYALDRGMFQDRGIELEIKYYYGGPELCSAVAAGEIQVGAIGLPPFIKAYSQGLPARIIGSTILQQLDHYLVARPGIHTLADLKGKKIGILSTGSCDSYFIRRMLRDGGLDGDREVELKAMGKALGGDLSCFTDGEIDAGFVVEPKIALGESKGIFNVLARVGDYYPHYQWGIMFATDAYLARNAPLVTGIMDAYRQACREIKAAPEKSLALGAEVFGVDQRVFQRAVNRDLANWEIEGRIDMSGLRNAIRVQRQMGVIDQDLDVEKMVRQM